ncbi:MAG: glycosyltransferase family 4 protein [Rhodospirillales bacterium]|nr:glycosyltransferase family 4 protein [Rhodospirillales bacterium]
MTTARPVRVLINALHAKTGGGLTYLRAMLPRLAARADLEIHLLVHTGQRSLLGVAHSQIIRHEVDFPDGFVRRLLWEQIVLPHYAWSLAEVTFSPANFGPLLAPRPVILLRNALAVGAHETRPAKKLYWAALGLMTRLSVWRARSVLAVSRYAASALGFRRSGIAIVPHGVDHQRFHPGSQAREDFLLAVGDVTLQKNYHTLIDAMAAIPGRSLLIAGRMVDPDYGERLRSQVDRLGLGDRARFLGAVEPDGLADLYRRCALFVMPSTVETFGNPLVEAMASGCPIVCASATALPEILGDAGQLFDPGNPNDLALKIGIVLNDKARSAELAERGRERAKLFSWDSTAAHTAQALIAAGKTEVRLARAGLGWAWVAGLLIAYLAQFTELGVPILTAVIG